MSITKNKAKKLFRREVYRNLHFRDETIYSVRNEGLVEGHALQVVMDDCALAVGRKGNQRVRDEQRKNVHAVIRGYIINAVWYPENEDELDWAKDVAASTEEMEWGVPASLNTKMDCDDPAAWTPMFEWKRIIYNPYKYKTFVTAEDEQPIFYARKVIVGPKVWAMVPTRNKQKEN